MTSSALWPILTTPIEREADVVAVRQRARRMAERLGFETQDQTRIATAVSEIARNAFTYAGGGRAEFALDGDALPQVFVIRVSDRGGGIRDLDAILEGRYRSPTGMGLGIIGAQRLMDRFEIALSAEGGTLVTMGKARPRQADLVTKPFLGDLAAQLARERADDPLALLSDQNRELIRGLDELRERQDELRRLNSELEDTNRGVVALYAELDEKAEQLRQASEMKSRFLANMSHEFRTPLNSILALARLLLDRTDGELTDEQERQVTYILRSAGGLTELVNDLLDLAKVEAGKVEVRPTAFTVADLFSGLRGALKPLRSSDAVDLVFEEPQLEMPELFTDEAKVAQILRNLISNALKFTEHGEVRVAARHEAATDIIRLAVSDTGIGIALEDQHRIFDEFAQVDSGLQRRSKGTGLGLPLSRKLAELLGGEILVESKLGQGSTFVLSIPRSVHAEDASSPTVPDASAGRLVLMIDDDETSRYVLRQFLPIGFEIVEAADGAEGLRQAREQQPDLILLDLNMPVLDGFAVIKALGADPAMRDIPVIVSTSAVIDADLLARVGDRIAVLSKQKLTKATLSGAIEEAEEMRRHG